MAVITIQPISPQKEIQKKKLRIILPLMTHDFFDYIFLRYQVMFMVEVVTRKLQFQGTF